MKKRLINKGTVFFIASHAVFNKTGNPMHGTGSEISTVLKKSKVPHVFVMHPLYRGSNTFVETYSGTSQNTKRIGFFTLPFIFMRLQELMITIGLLIKAKDKPTVFVGIDPFNGFSAIMAKRLGLTKYAVFYTADYAYKRFGNKLLNGIYHLTDRFCVRYSDQVWNVSTRMVELRQKQGLPSRKNFFVPNTPQFIQDKVSSLLKINKHNLVIVSSLTSSLDYNSIFLSVKKLLVKYPDTKLLVIGEGEEESRLPILIKRFGLKNKIVLLGKMEHPQVIEILTKSGIGLAIYTRENSWTEFGDSMKVREYLACGLPVVMNDVVSTADDIKKENVGFVLKNKEKDYSRYIDRIFSNENLYLKMKKNAINLARKNDFTRVFKSTINVLDNNILK